MVVLLLISFFDKGLVEVMMKVVSCGDGQTKFWQEVVRFFFDFLKSDEDALLLLLLVLDMFLECKSARDFVKRGQFLSPFASPHFAGTGSHPSQNCCNGATFFGFYSRWCLFLVPAESVSKKTGR